MNHLIKEETMEKINVAELLSNCPSGMELDCTMFEGVEFDGIVDNKYTPIRCRIKNPDGGYNVYFFTKHGYWNDDCKAKCVIFPKGKTTWEGFMPPCQFKVGDRIRHKCPEFRGERIISSCGKDGYWTSISDWIGYKCQDDWELVSNKFDITTLVPFESKVLARDGVKEKWYPAIWGYYDSDCQNYPYKLIGDIARYCIPYEGNEHLLGKTDDCNEHFKSWK